MFISTQNNFAHFDHGSYKPPALALLSLYYINDGIIKLKLLALQRITCILAASYMKGFFADGTIRCLVYDDFL